MQVNPLVTDISSYQNVSDWDKVKKSGIVGVINKATEGHTWTDRTFIERFHPVIDNGMLYGAYHFLRPGDMPGQVDHFLDVVSKVADPNQILLALDHEDPKVPLEDAKLFLRLLRKRTTQVPVLYSGFLIKQQLTSFDAELAQTRLWLAHYSNTPTWPTHTWKNLWLWQYTGDGVGPPPHDVDGIDGTGLDINSYDGTPAQLQNEWLMRATQAGAVTPKETPTVNITTNTATVTATVLNLRVAPNAAIIGQLTEGTLVEVLGKNNGWVAVKSADGKQGWVSESFLKNNPKRM
jgi:lysozyme